VHLVILVTIHQETLVDGVQIDDEKVVHWVQQGPSRRDERYCLAIARHLKCSSSTRASTWRTTDADGTGARPPHRLLVSLRVPREHVGSE
jgi:hypothetical protein